MGDDATRLPIAALVLAIVLHAYVTRFATPRYDLQVVPADEAEHSSQRHSPDSRADAEWPTRSADRLAIDIGIVRDRAGTPLARRETA